MKFIVVLLAASLLAGCTGQQNDDPVQAANTNAGGAVAGGGAIDTGGASALMRATYSLAGHQDYFIKHTVAPGYYNHYGQGDVMMETPFSGGLQSVDFTVTWDSSTPLSDSLTITVFGERGGVRLGEVTSTSPATFHWAGEYESNHVASLAFLIEPTNLAPSPLVFEASVNLDFQIEGNLTWLEN